MRILLSGYLGHMGNEVRKIAEKGFLGAEIVAGVDSFCKGSEDFPCVKTFFEANTDVDCIVDFSHHSNTKEMLNFAIKNKIPTVIATTGQTEEEKQMIVDASKKIPIFFASNYSMGVALLLSLSKQALRVFNDGDVEIVEVHHNRKIDAPSGTALTIAEELKKVKDNAEIISGRSGMKKRGENEIAISSLRLGNIVGEHEVIIDTGLEQISIKHTAHDRALFAEGALRACEFICSLKKTDVGLYDMKSIVKV